MIGARNNGFTCFQRLSQRVKHLGIEADGVFAEFYKLPGYSVFPAPPNKPAPERSILAALTQKSCWMIGPP